MAITLTHDKVASDPESPLLTDTDWNANHNIESLIKSGNFVDVNGWTTMSDDFTRGAVVADYGLVNNSNGTSAAATVAASAYSSSQRALIGYLQLTTGTTATGHASAYYNDSKPTLPNANLIGSKYYIKAANVVMQSAPDATNDFDLIMCWISELVQNTQNEDLTTTVNAYFRQQRLTTNYEFRYVDDTNTMQTINTGVAWSAAIPRTFEAEYEIGASAATSTIKGWIDGVLVASATGVKLPTAGIISLRPARIEKLAGTTAAVLYVDAATRGYYTPQRWY